MSRKRTDEEIEAELQAEDELRDKRNNCSHYNCEPVEWYWSGAIQTMWCRDCGEREWRDDPNE